ncbi:MAG: hypothetical protein ABR974_12005 [Bacteroidales bacterium]|jgi:hypothetical protein
MNRYRYISLSVLILVLAVSRVNGQFTGINADTFNIKNFKEEIYVRTDRDIYITGEQIWMKIYKLNRMNSSPANESKIIYLEMLDNLGNIVRQMKVSVDGFSGAASMRIADTLRTGNYLIRAYTNWMQNYSEDLFFYKYVSIINPFRNIDRLINRTMYQFPDSVKFFPEGGQLISGVRNRVGVRSTDPEGYPLKMEGVIVSNNGEVICPVKTDTLGYGVISLTPSKTEPLFVQFNGKGSILKKQPMPEIIEKGFTLTAEPVIKSSAFKLKILNTGNYKDESRNGWLTIISSGLINLRRQLNFDTDSVINVPFTSIPSGSSLVILSDGAGNRIADRWIFNSSNRILNLSLDLPKQEFSARQEINLVISTADQSGLPVMADLSISVVKTCLTEKKGINILYKDEYSAAPGEWLSGLTDKEMNDDLLAYKGNMNDEGYLLTQADSVPLHLPELGGQLVNGVLKNRLDHVPLKATDISLSFIGKTAKCQFLKTDNNGEFNFVVNKPGLSEIVIQPLESISSGYYVEFNQPFCTTFNDHVPPVFNLDSTKTDGINQAIISMQVNNIYEPFRQQKVKVAGKTNNHDFYGEPDKKINLSDYIELTTVREVIKEIVPDVMVLKRNKEYLFKLVNLPPSSSENSPLVMVDGVPIFNIGKLLDVKSKEIERIDILNSRYYYTDYIFDGIVSFITKKGNLSSMEYDNSVFRQVFEGCQVPQEFYSPDYSTKTEGTYRIPDFRNTLYWKPDLRSDSKGKASVSFFTSDEPGDYTIIVEGITADGKTGIARVPLHIK